MSDSAEPTPPFRTGFVTVIGRPNVGKSTLVNRLVGQKVAIVSDKPQTTRHRIRGILTTQRAQFVFVDTPGYQTRHRSALNRYMSRGVRQAVGDADCVMLVVEAGRFLPEDRRLAHLIGSAVPVVLAVNKIDRIPKPKILPALETWSRVGEFDEIIPLSALKGDNVDRLEQILISRLPEGKALYPDDFLTDLPERFFVAEMVRERILHHTRQEIPYVTGVVIESFKEEGGLVRIHVAILVERDNQKGILIGRGGAMLKTVGTEARQQIEAFLGTKVFLGLFVKVREHWRENPRILEDMGLGKG